MIAFDITQRAIPCLLRAVRVFLAVTVFEIYFYPNLANYFLTVFSLIYHSDVSAVLLLLILAHVFYDMRKPGSADQMKPSRFDLSTLKERSRAFFSPNDSKTGSSHIAEDDEPGRSSTMGGKYDVFMKSYHWMLTASLGVLGVTGFYFWDPYNIVSTFVNIPLWLQAIFLDLHILAAVLTVGLMIGHVYFALLPVNRPILNSLLSGRLEEDYYIEHHDAQLWPPNMIKVKSSTFARLPNSLSDANFRKLTGYEDRAVLRKKKEIAVPFAAIQKTCGKYSTGSGRCSAKQGGEMCSSESCPVLGTYLSPRARSQRRKILKEITVGVTVVGFLAIGIDSAYRVLVNQKSPVSQQGGTLTGGQTTAVQGTNTLQAIANFKSLANNSSIYFSDSQGNPDLLIKLADGSLEAYSAICTHAGCQVGYDPTYETIYCPCHGAQFDPTNGSVTNGPAFYGLPKVQIRIDQSTGEVYIG